MKRSPQPVPIILGFLMAWYLLATLPYLQDFPRMEWAQPMIAAPAWRLADQGIFGSEMFAGFYGAEEHNYDHMPLYGLFLALSFKILGLGIWQARMVSVLAGLATIMLTFQLGRTLFGPEVGLLASAMLCFLRLSLPNEADLLQLGYQMNASGIPLVDFARVIRFDVMVPVWVLAACLAFLQGMRNGSRQGYLLAGVFSGLAALSHLYGAFILAVFALLFLWEHGRRAPRLPGLYIVMIGFLVCLVPYAIFVLADLPGFLGQSLRHEARFDLLNLRFYWDSLLHEPWRYLSWLGGSFRHAVLWPRAGVWVLVAAVPVANLHLLRRASTSQRLASRFLLLSLPVLAGALAVLINLKRYPYTALILPFLALQIAFAGMTAWKGNDRTPGFFRLLLLAVLAAVWVEGVAGVLGSFRQAQAATPYARIVETLRTAIPGEARVLASHSVWFALHDYDLRSVNLAFVLSDPRYGFQPAPPLEEVILAMAPDYIVMENRLLKKYLDNPQGLPSSRDADTLRAFDAFIQKHCPEVVALLLAEDYGDIYVYRCDE